MKNILLALSIIFVSYTTGSEEPADKIGVKGPLVFNNVTYNLVWSDHPTDKYYIQEYLPEGEKLEHFDQMLTIHLFDIDIDLQEAVEQKVKELIERKKTDAVCNYQVAKSPDGKEFIVDFLLGESNEGQMTTVELNIYRYKKIELAKKRKAVLVYSFTKRSYGEDIGPFFTTLKSDRMNFLNEMTSTDLPKIVIESK